MTKINTINKAISEADLLFINGTLIKPYTLEGANLFYQDLSSGENGTVDIRFTEVESYEEGQV